MLRLLLLKALCFSLLAQQQGRVYLISLDGLGFEAFSEDPAAQELRTMHKLAAEGIYAPMQSAFPSLTAPAHASLFTGVYGDRNGITANQIPLEFDRRVNGFRGEYLRADTFWVKAAASGIRSVAHNPTQGFPCNAHNSGSGVTLINGYQTEELSPQRLLRGEEVEWLPESPARFAPPPASRRPVLYFQYTSGRLQFTGAVFAKGFQYDTIRLSARSGARYVDAPLKSAEMDPPLASHPARPLARYFSQALPIAGIAAVHFRLFELAESGKQFLLYQTEAKPISVCHNGETQNEGFKKRLLQTAGAFIGNGAGRFYEEGRFGPRSTDGIAERRWLETLELHARQTMRHARALLAEFNPRLLIDYLSTADDLLHVWWGSYKQGDRFQEPWRRWGYQIIDWRIHELRQLLGPADHVLIVSDHGMTSARREFRLNTLLRQWGYANRVWAQDSFLRLKDRRDDALLAELRSRLSHLRDGETSVFASWFLPAEARARFGIGGEFGGDLYFDLAPGYYLSSAPKEPVFESYSIPRGVHGPLPTRPDLLALFLAHGPQLQSRPVSMRSVDVAPLILKLLGL
ncbi:MAG: alkaline phosphatase family protein [Acidobacteriota bacterium]|jgi:hypothetical protein